MHTHWKPKRVYIYIYYCKLYHYIYIYIHIHIYKQDMHPFGYRHILMFFDRQKHLVYIYIYYVLCIHIFTYRFICVYIHRCTVPVRTYTYIYIYIHQWLLTPCIGSYHLCGDDSLRSCKWPWKLCGLWNRFYYPKRRPCPVHGSSPIVFSMEFSGTPNDVTLFPIIFPYRFGRTPHIVSTWLNKFCMILSWPWPMPYLPHKGGIKLEAVTMHLVPTSCMSFFVTF